MGQSEAERLARLEEQNKNLCKRMDEMSRKLDEVHNALISAKGAKWMLGFLVTFAAVLGGFVSQFLPMK